MTAKAYGQVAVWWQPMIFGFGVIETLWWRGHLLQAVLASAPKAPASCSISRTSSSKRPP